jgi:hypothetical protein
MQPSTGKAEPAGPALLGNSSATSIIITLLMSFGADETSPLTTSYICTQFGVGVS